MFFLGIVRPWFNYYNLTKKHGSTMVFLVRLSSVAAPCCMLQSFIFYSCKFYCSCDRGLTVCIIIIIVRASVISYHTIVISVIIVSLAPGTLPSDSWSDAT